MFTGFGYGSIIDAVAVLAAMCAVALLIYALVTRLLNLEESDQPTSDTRHGHHKNETVYINVHK